MRSVDKRQMGFTLIEIIAVLVILGILAAVAVPKYYDLQDEAKRKAALAAVAEAQARFNMSFGQELLAGRDCKTARTNAATTVFSAASTKADMGNDWTVAIGAMPGTGLPSEKLTVTVENNGKPVAAPTDRPFQIITPDCSATQPKP